MEKNDAQNSGFAVVKKARSPWKKSLFDKNILPAYLYRWDLQNGVRKFFKNKWVSSFLTFGDFSVPKNCSLRKNY